MSRSMDINDLRQNLQTVVKKGNGDVVKINMNEVFDKVDESLQKQEFDAIMKFLSELRMGIANLAYDFENRCSMKEDAFRKWKGELNSKLTSKGDDNPLKQKGRKTTNTAIKAELRSRDKYKQYKDEITKLKNSKNALWSAKNVVEDLIDFVMLKMKASNPS